MISFNLGEPPLNETDARMTGPLKLAYLGDAVLDLFVRDYMVKHDLGKVKALHKKAVTIVNASAQAEFILMITPELSEDEVNIFKRGRNAKSGMQPKNANVKDYRIATGFEALLGYLYLCGKHDRLNVILSRLFETVFKPTID